MSIQTPVLFITFARPEYARKAFAQIKNAKPKIFYFYSNKARKDNQLEMNNNNEVRELLDKVDWECELKTFIRDEYVDLYTSVFSAIDWVFESEEQAIILEEDCVATKNFFNLCEMLLRKYKDDKKVWMISGDNFTEKGNKANSDYIFSCYSHIYGWASWKNRWSLIDRTMAQWEDVKKIHLFRQYFYTKSQANYVERLFENFYVNMLPNKPAWDFLFWYSAIINNSYTIFPRKHMVENIGLLGFHNRSNKVKSWNRKPSDFQQPIQFHPSFIYPDISYDSFHFYNHIKQYKIKLLTIRLANKIIKLLTNRNA